MSRYTPVIIVVLALAVAVGAVLFAVRRSPPPAGGKGAATGTPAAGAATPAPQALEVKGAEVEQRDAAGKLQWKVTAGGQLQFDKGRQRAQGRDVHFEIMQAGKPEIIVEAPQFDADYATRKLTFNEGASGHLADGSGRFAVKHLEYDLATRKLLGSGGATYAMGPYTASAPELVLDTASKKLRLKGGLQFRRSE